MHGQTNSVCVRMLRITLNLLPKIRRLHSYDVNVTYAQPHSRTTYVNDVKYDAVPAPIHDLPLLYEG